jgi:hypothetical protein
MDYTTIRVSTRTHKLIKNLAKTAKLPQQAIVAQSIEYYAEKKFWEECDKSYQNLKKNNNLSDEMKERRSWENTLSDDID